MRNKTLIFLFLIVVAGSFLRLYRLSDFPPALNWDEVSHGYNAYSILKTGADEWGEKWPLLSFRAYGDYPLPLNLYLTAPFIFFLGPSEYSIRLPHAILGIFTIVSTYFLAYGVTKKKSIGAISSFLIAVSPWTLFSSRFVVQSNASVFLLTTSMALFFNREKRAYFLPISFFLLFLTLFSYHSTRIFSALLLITILIVYRNEFIKKLKSNNVFSRLSFGILLAFFVTLLIILLNPQSRARGKWVFIINEGAINKIIEMRNSSNLPYGVKRLIYNRPVYFVVEFAKNYLGYFSPKYLFLGGGTQYQFSVPNQGLEYLINLPFFYLGLALFVIKAFKKKSLKEKLIIGWLILAPIPAAVTTEKYAVIRSTTMLPLVEILTAVGLIFVFERLSKERIGKALFAFSYFIIIFLLLAKYLSIYFGSYSNNYSWSWQYGYKEIVAYAKENYKSYDQIIVTKKYGEPHEFFLFYWPWNPADYRNDPNLVRFFQSNWYWVDAFDKFYFVNDWDITASYDGFVMESGGRVDCTAGEVKCLLITSPKNSPEGWKKLEQIDYLDGKSAFEIYEN